MIVNNTIVSVNVTLDRDEKVKYFKEKNPYSIILKFLIKNSANLLNKLDSCLIYILFS